MTVILTNHDMDDIEALCTPVMVIGHGRILSDGKLEDLRARVTTKRLPWWCRWAAYPFLVAALERTAPLGTPVTFRCFAPIFSLIFFILSLQL